MSSERRHKYEYTVDLEGDTAPARVVRMVGSHKRVLEVGAGPGSITRLLKEAGGARVTAVEIDSVAIERLRPFCERVYQADLNDDGWVEALTGERDFDVVVIADVLEHLQDPWTILGSLRGFLADHGYLVVSLPHAGHNAVIACLLNGDFEYRDWGLLDRTHIRFFGIDNIQTLFEQAGLKITDTEFVVRRPEDTEFAPQWARLSGDLRVALDGNSFGTIYQVVIQAVPEEKPGQALSLRVLGAEARPPSNVVAEPVSAGLTKSLRALARKYLKPETRQSLRQLLERWR